MKPGNRHVCEMVPIHSKCNTLIDERNDDVHTYIRSAFLLISRKVFLFYLIYQKGGAENDSTRKRT